MQLRPFPTLHHRSVQPRLLTPPWSRPPEEPVTHHLVTLHHGSDLETRDDCAGVEAARALAAARYPDVTITWDEPPLLGDPRWLSGAVHTAGTAVSLWIMDPAYSSAHFLVDRRDNAALRQRRSGERGGHPGNARPRGAWHIYALSRENTRHLRAVEIVTARTEEEAVGAYLGKTLAPPGRCWRASHVLEHSSVTHGWYDTGRDDLHLAIPEGDLWRYRLALPTMVHFPRPLHA